MKLYSMLFNVVLFLNCVLVAVVHGGDGVGGNPPSPWSHHNVKYNGLKISMGVAKPNLAYLAVMNELGFSLYPPDLGKLKELEDGYDPSPGMIGNWTGMYVNDGAHDKNDAQVILEPIITPAGERTVVVHKLGGVSQIQSISCKCVPAFPPTCQVQVHVKHVWPDKTSMQKLVVGRYSSQAECEAKYLSDFKYCKTN